MKTKLKKQINAKNHNSKFCPWCTNDPYCKHHKAENVEKCLLQFILLIKTISHPCTVFVIAIVLNCISDSVPVFILILSHTVDWQSLFCPGTTACPVNPAGGFGSGLERWWTCNCLLLCRGMDKSGKKKEETNNVNWKCTTVHLGLKMGCKMLAQLQQVSSDQVALCCHCLSDTRCDMKQFPACLMFFTEWIACLIFFCALSSLGLVSLPQ